jgi:hypothetical protein
MATTVAISLAAGGSGHARAVKYAREAAALPGLGFGALRAEQCAQVVS